MSRGIAIALSLLLFVSVAVNVFAVGFLSGRVITAGPPEHRTAPVHRDSEHPMGIMRHAKGLPPESREAFREAIRTGIPEMRAERRKIRDLQRAYHAALGAEEWDRAAVETALGELQTARDKSRASIDKAFIDALESLAPADRALLLERAEASRKKRRERRHRQWGDK